MAVPEKSIGRSFQNTDLMKYGFFADWRVAQQYNLCDTTDEKDKAVRFKNFFHQDKNNILVCAHATLRNGMKEISDEEFNDCLLAIDEFHHTSADVNSGLEFSSAIETRSFFLPLVGQMTLKSSDSFKTGTISGTGRDSIMNSAGQTLL